ncbi:unnamed protein product, partial [Mycena citricolor]
DVRSKVLHCAIRLRLSADEADLDSEPRAITKTMSLLSLPPEIIEHVLVEAVIAGHPNSVAAASSCCRFLHNLVNEIWRELFLCLFDDPRTLQAIKDSAGQSTPANSTRANPFDWTTFTARIGAANSLRSGNAGADFRALIDTVHTAAPSSPVRSDPTPRRSVVLPPILRTLTDSPKSKSLVWIEEILSEGLPAPLIYRLFNLFNSDGSEFSRPDFEDTVQGKAFSKLTFLAGMHFSDDEAASSARSMARSRIYNTKYLMSERCWGPFEPIDRSPDAYSWRLRMTGTNSNIKSSRVASNEKQPASETSSRNIAHPSSIVIGPDFYTDDGSDYEPDSNVSDEESDDSDSDDVMATPHFLQFLSSHGIDFTDVRTHPTYVFPAPHRVVPDYAFLAAARYLMECNMRERFEAEFEYYRDLSAASEAAKEVGLEPCEVVDAMQSLDLTRMGGAPGFWDVWRPEIDEEHVLEQLSPVDQQQHAPVDKGKGKASAAEVVEGWDWAGVEGEWRRVVCWLDYRDLLMHNVDLSHAGFASSSAEDVQETIRIFPTSLRVSHYSKPPKPPPGSNPNDLIWRLPIIHIIGESWGTDTEEASRRSVEGTVRMIGDGCVRWSMVSSEAAGADPEWATESVQVGEIGSAAGIIGLWTGAEHTSTDPLGMAQSLLGLENCLTTSKR